MKQNIDYDKPQKGFVAWLRNVWLGIVDSFKYNPCKLAGILIALPGLFIGFFLGTHSQVQFYVLKGEFDFSGLFMFILVLLGCVNIFNGVTLMSKKNLGTIITSAICSIVITIVGILWIQRIFYSMELVNSGQVILPEGKLYELGKYEIQSILSVCASILCSIVGCIYGYIKRDKNYKKVKF